MFQMEIESKAITKWLSETQRMCNKMYPVWLFQSINSLHVGKFILISCCMMFFFSFKLTFFFSKNSFRNTVRVSNSLHPDQSPNSLQKLSAEGTARQRFKITA